MYEQRRPRYVFCYGKDHWTDLERVFHEPAFDDIEPGRVRVAHMNGSTVVLTHHFSSWFMTDARIDRIAEYIERRH